MKEKFEKITNVRLPFDMRHADDSKNYGIHCLDVWFILKGKKGAVQYAASFRAYLPHVHRELESKGGIGEPIYGFDVGYHSRTPMYDGQTAMQNCNVFDGEPCYYDGSSLAAARWTELIFSTTGSPPEEVLWKMLEDEYEKRFGKDQDTTKCGEAQESEK